MADASFPFPPAPDQNAQPFTFAALASKNLIRGELIMFYVDAKGRITADKLDVLPTAPRVAKIPQP